MNFALVVVRAFGSHRTGDTINAEDMMRQVLASEHALYVVRVPNTASEETTITAARED